MINPNATQAAIRAGYSPKTARSIGQENLTKPDIAAAVKQAQDARAERTEVTADEVVLQLKRYAFSSMRDYVDDKGNLLDVHELTPDAAVGIASVEVLRERTRTSDEHSVTTVEQTIKIKRWNPLRALELLGRHLGLFRDRVEHGADVSLLDFLSTTRPRLGIPSI